MISETLFDDGVRKWVFFGRDPARPAHIIDTNEYLVVHDGKGTLLDPGGIEVFPAVVTAVSSATDLNVVESMLASHQDPDIISSLSLWSKLMPDLRVYCSQIWSDFLSHFEFDVNFVLVPDEGGTLPLNGSTDLQIVPAHYCHSSGNFSVYDPRARILFSGDIGAALLPESHRDIRVRSFDEHVRFMEGFHRRWMPSMAAKSRWVERVAALDVDLMCPQHGAVFEGEDVGRFLQWFDELEVASAIAV